jgi:hypothetical protein
MLPKLGSAAYPFVPDGRPPRDVERKLAKLLWKLELQKQSANSFLVPFSTDPQAFGSPEAYEAYRNTPIWRDQRERVLNRAGGKCVGCSCKASEVHHRDYRPRVLSGEDDSPLVALCWRCHRHIHKRGPNGIDPSWQEEEARLASLVAREDERILRGAISS